MELFARLQASNVCLGPDGRISRAAWARPRRRRHDHNVEVSACLQARNVCLGPDGRMYPSDLGAAKKEKK